MKKLFIALTCLLLLTSVAMASPLTDFSQGKGSIDLTWTNAENNISGTTSQTFDKKYNLDSALTFGLTDNFAFQYRNFEPKSDNTIFTRTGNLDTFQLQTNEVNVLYKLDKNVNALAGWVNGKGTMAGPDANNTPTKNLYQIGLIASTAIADKTTLWGSAAAGKDLTNYAVGVGYEFSPGWEFNVNYRDLEIKDFSTAHGSINGETKGLGFGVTYKF